MKLLLFDSKADNNEIAFVGKQNHKIIYCINK
jgi:hypothetical protein